VADFDGRLAFFDSAGQKVVHTARARLALIYHIAVINDSLVAFGGREEAANNDDMLHVWNLRRDSMVVHAFNVPAPRGYEVAYGVSGLTTVSTHGDTVAAVFALKDTIYLFRPDGRPLGRIPFQFRAFRPLRKPAPDVEDPTDKRFRQWQQSYSVATGIFWLTDGSFLIQYFDRVGTTTPEWRLAHVDRNGRSLAEVVGSSHMIGMLPGDSLVFQKPGSDTPNVWSIGTIASR